MKMKFEKQEHKVPAMLIAIAIAEKILGLPRISWIIFWSSLIVMFLAYRFKESRTFTEGNFSNSFFYT